MYERSTAMIFFCFDITYHMLSGTLGQNAICLAGARVVQRAWKTTYQLPAYYKHFLIGNNNNKVVTAKELSRTET